MTEWFVKTFKRDCVYVHDRPDAQKFLAQLALTLPGAEFARFDLHAWREAQKFRG
jgi:hypothetical protein